jgi:hypothetical protein
MDSSITNKARDRFGVAREDPIAVITAVLGRCSRYVGMWLRVSWFGETGEG